MSVKLLTEHHLEFLKLKGSCTGLSESTLVKMPHCWKSHVTAHIFFILCFTAPAAMVYVTVKEETNQKLHLSREPSNSSWALLIGQLNTLDVFVDRSVKYLRYVFVDRSVKYLRCIC